MSESCYTISVYFHAANPYSRETATVVERQIQEVLADHCITSYIIALKPGIPGDISDQLDEKDHAKGQTSNDNARARG